MKIEGAKKQEADFFRLKNVKAQQVLALIAILAISGLLFAPVFAQNLIKKERQGTKLKTYDFEKVRSQGHDFAVLAGGCFWCIEAVYEEVDGVISAVSGYTGGTDQNPDYEKVSAGTTGHAETVVVEFDPKKISYAQILDLFFKAHDPGSLNRQGADVGTQYRSAVFYADELQKSFIEEKIKQLKKTKTLVTQVAPLGTFWIAEDYHQDYYKNHPFQGYCNAVIRPKLEKLSGDIKLLNLDP